MTPNYDKAATMATELLIEHAITAAPVSPLPMLKRPNVLVVSFTEVSAQTGLDRDKVLSVFSKTQDAVTSCFIENGQKNYVVAYNQRLPIHTAQKALARQLGHVVLEHDGSRPDDVRKAEETCFAYHLLCPRPLIHAVQEAGIEITMNVLTSMTSCDSDCVAGMKDLQCAHVPAELNRKVKALFADYVKNFVNYRKTVTVDNSAPVDFGHYLEGYVD